MTTNNYYIIGGQYSAHCYGSTPTLTGAKRIASGRAELWDNWQGWHIPAIYRAEDVREVCGESGAYIVPEIGAVPVATAHYSPSGRVVWEA